MNEAMLQKIKDEGVTLHVEVSLSYEEFKQLLETTFGCEFTEEDMHEYWHLTARRILPPDAGSFSGIGSDIGDLVREGLKSQRLSKEEK